MREPFRLSCSDDIARRLWPREYGFVVREYDASINKHFGMFVIAPRGAAPFSVPNQVPRSEWAK